MAASSAHIVAASASESNSDDDDDDVATNVDDDDASMLDDDDDDDMSASSVAGSKADTVRNSSAHCSDVCQNDDDVRTLVLATFSSARRAIAASAPRRAGGDRMNRCHDNNKNASQNKPRLEAVCASVSSSVNNIAALVGANDGDAVGATPGSSSLCVARTTKSALAENLYFLSFVGTYFVDRSNR